MAQTRLERLLMLKEGVKDCMADGLNMRGWTVVFKTKINEKMFRWNQMEKVQ